MILNDISELLIELHRAKYVNNQVTLILQKYELVCPQFLPLICNTVLCNQSIFMPYVLNSKPNINRCNISFISFYSNF